MDSNDIRICFVGDSFVNGTGDPACLGWSGRICAAAASAGHPVTSYNLGIRRDTSTDIETRWLTECLRRLPPACDCRVVFSFGVNDTALEDGRRRVLLDATCEQTNRMLQRARQRYTTLMIGPPPVADEPHNERIFQLCDALQAVAIACQVPYLKVCDTLHRSSTWMGEVARNDGSHPQAGGYAELAALVQHWPHWWFP